VEEIKDEDDDSSDSIMELEAEDPLAGPPPPPSQTEKTKSGPNIVTIDDVKALQLLAASSAKKLQESDKVVLIDTNTILAGKATSGVTITPAKPRVLPLGSGTIGSGVTISHASSKPMSRGVGLPMGTTMTSLGSGSSNSALSATQNSGFTYDKQGQLNDPNLTDDTFVVEAPSFIVPYVYEKPPKETFSAFKASIETLTKNLKKKVDITDDDNEKDEKENDKSSEPVPEVKKPSGETFFDSHLGNFVINLGMNLVQEHVQTDLLREQTKKSQKDKSASVMHAIMSLKKNLEASKDKNDGFPGEPLRNAPHEERDAPVQLLSFRDQGTAGDSRSHADQTRRSRQTRTSHCGTPVSSMPLRRWHARKVDPTQSGLRQAVQG